MVRSPVSSVPRRAGEFYDRVSGGDLTAIRRNDQCGCRLRKSRNNELRDVDACDPTRFAAADGC